VLFVDHIEGQGKALIKLLQLVSATEKREEQQAASLHVCDTWPPQRIRLSRKN
jgi:hypothetical protein